MSYCCSSISNWGPWSASTFRPNVCRCATLIYIAVTALTRVLAIDIKEMSDTHMITLTSAILTLCVAVLVLRIGSTRFNEDDGIEK